MEASTREVLDDSIRFWERGRVLCNVVLAGVVLFWLGVAWPFLPPNWMVPLAGALFMLAVLANVFYCAAYVADLPLQHSSYRDGWRRWRWVLWLIGTLFAVLLASIWIYSQLFPPMGF